MKIEKNTVVKLDFIVTDEENRVLNAENRESIEVLIGHDQLVKGFEDAIIGHEAGDKINAVVPPELGYGEYNPGLVQEIDRNLFDGMELKEGDTFLADTDLGKMPLTVSSIKEDKVVVDGNHPFAGKTLKYMIEIENVRAATESEIQHGHVHGEHGCCHDHDHEEDHCCCGHHHHDHDEEGEHKCCGRHHHEHDEAHEGEHKCCGGHGHHHHDHDEDHECCCHKHD